MLVTGYITLGSFHGDAVAYLRITAYNVSGLACLYVLNTRFDIAATKSATYNGTNWGTNTYSSATFTPDVYLIWLVYPAESSAPRTLPASDLDAIASEKYICEVEGVSGTPYYWRLLTTPLATPTGLYADNITSDSARVSWTAVENASGYKVEYRQAGGGGGQTFPWVEAQD